MTRTENRGTTARRLWGNPAALVYLALVLGIVVFALVNMTLTAGPDASMAGVWIYVVTAPVSILLMAAGSTATWYVVLSLVLSALIQSAVIGALYSTFRDRRKSSQRSSLA